MTFDPDQFAKSLIHHFEHEEIEAKIVRTDEKNWDVSLTIECSDEEDDFENNYYIGNYADPGMHITLLGSVILPDGLDHELVLVNGVVFEAFAAHIVGWAVGYN